MYTCTIHGHNKEDVPTQSDSALFYKSRIIDFPSKFIPYNRSYAVWRSTLAKESCPWGLITSEGRRISVDARACVCVSSSMLQTIRAHAPSDNTQTYYKKSISSFRLVRVESLLIHINATLTRTQLWASERVPVRVPVIGKQYSVLRRTWENDNLVSSIYVVRFRYQFEAKRFPRRDGINSSHIRTYVQYTYYVYVRLGYLPITVLGNVPLRAKE